MMSVEQVIAKLESGEKAALERLIEWLSIPSVGTDPAYTADTRRAAEWAVTQLREVGIAAELRETGEPGRPGNPIVWAQHPGSPEYTGPHVLFYGHYDVQPADPLDLWESPPFQPVIKPADPNGPGERIVARGAVDDKGQVHTFLEALRAWKNAAGEIPVRFTILIEGEEESGSVNLEKFVRDHSEELSKTDVCLVSDTGMLNRETPAITSGMRGLVYTEVVLHAANQDLHSGLWGGRCPNPINELTKVLAQLWDEKRRVTIPGFYDGVHEIEPSLREQWRALPLDAKKSLAKIGLEPDANVGEEGFTSVEREWARPTCDINGIFGGYQGAGAKTVIPAHAGAKVSFRLVDEQNHAKIMRQFQDWLEERTPPGCRWEFHDHGGGPPATVSTDSPHLQAALRALEKASNVKPAIIRSGGSIPVVGLFKQIIGLDTILMGFGLEDDRVHSPNEKFELTSWRLGARAHARLIDEFMRM
ncbi:MAG: M20/M25/M40 family metallo-hydrolase [Phycisphaeraceae bacterium]|nr:MAG: M20/M25/M40 family metallo-hydrolase [Phycisphaeraceae bacterium]